MARDHVLMWRPTLVWTPRALRLACWAIGAISALLLTTGCVNGGTASPTTVASTRPGIAARTTVTAESPTTSTATSSTTGTAPFGVPIAARVDSVDGAVEFVKFAVAQVNLAYVKGEPSRLDVVFSPQCPGCAFIKKDAQNLVELKQRAGGNPWVANLVAPNTWDRGRATVELRGHQEKTEILDVQGRRVDFFAPGDFHCLITLTHSGTDWIIVRWQEVG